jgi:hypothetical protein
MRGVPFLRVGYRFALNSFDRVAQEGGVPVYIWAGKFFFFDDREAPPSRQREADLANGFDFVPMLSPFRIWTSVEDHAFGLAGDGTPPLLLTGGTPPRISSRTHIHHELSLENLFLFHHLHRHPSFSCYSFGFLGVRPQAPTE